MSSVCSRRGAEVFFWPITFLGAGVGWAVASIPGALLGAVLGQVLDRRLKIDSWAGLRELLGGAALPLEELLFVLLGRLAKSEGRVLEVHIEQARAEMRRLGLDAAALKRAIAAFSRGKRDELGLRKPLMRLRTDQERVRELLRACWRMALADGKLGERERELILLWGRWLGLSAAEVEDLQPPRKKRASGGVSPRTLNTYESALKLLGIPADSDLAVIKRAYRRLLSQHHPDKLAGGGASEAQVRQATEKTRELHAAYALVRERQGLR
ncbi:TerB family tellurite resistance protein [Pseudomonas sp. UBA6310]|uniref:TerB family tellurite resistance protein n=1 Tax=Pseudomonas sp. UBA6310 TaxID=1947327 RepID=UPI00257B5257|nr:TerB family tellurite resistance protein [Pseudomonas sp. UBA6310]